ncbi:coiled-coil domain-containing protein 84 isoform X1 [Python bivittatus]|uniref:Coiled-coil domain-containing protein 84 isoform X1 n=1 Tax=Python bivittatus TaxID=176946 RepID=A0A9F5JDE0_PYTBI|nr:coiled-coil domain-containing protein 84 isoform X1 [Python bivittatus]
MASAAQSDRLRCVSSFQESLSKALDAYEAKEDAAIQKAAAHIREVEQKRQEMVRAILEPQRASTLGDGTTAVNTFAGNLSDSPFAMEEQEQPGPSRSTTFLREEPTCASRTAPELHYLETGQPLTFIGHQETGGEGNIHTGAKPPWLMSEEEEGERQIGPSYEEFLKEKQKQKLKKLPPNRVGANFDHSSQTGDSWLPSFGRVWNQDISSKLNPEISSPALRGKGLKPTERPASPRELGKIHSTLTERESRDLRATPCGSPAVAVKGRLCGSCDETELCNLVYSIFMSLVKDVGLY